MLMISQQVFLRGKNMSEANKGYDQDVLNEFEKLKKRFEGPVEEPEDLSRTMVVPRVEDLIEERPLPKAAANDDFLFAAEKQDVPKFSDFDYELEFDEKEEQEALAEEAVIVSRAARKKASEDASVKEAKIKLPKIEKKEKKPKKENVIDKLTKHIEWLETLIDKKVK